MLAVEADLSELFYAQRTGDPHQMAGCDACKRLGLDYFALYNLSTVSAGQHVYCVNAFHTNYPPDWIEYYSRFNLIAHDPIIAFAPRATNATNWSEINNLRCVSADQKRVLSLATEHGIHSGMFMGFVNLSGDTQVVVFASSQPREFSQADLHEATVAGLYLSQRLRKSLICKQRDAYVDNVFTSRELECLTWAAIGKSSDEISAIIDITPNTVNFHMKKAMKKLDASTRMLAVVKALRIGLINP